jgi:hypothetical protein
MKQHCGLLMLLCYLNGIYIKKATGNALKLSRTRYIYTTFSESRCALRLRYVDLVVSIEAAVEVWCCCML